MFHCCKIKFNTFYCCKIRAKCFVAARSVHHVLLLQDPYVMFHSRNIRTPYTFHSCNIRTLCFIAARSVHHVFYCCRHLCSMLQRCNIRISCPIAARSVHRVILPQHPHTMFHSLLQRSAHHIFFCRRHLQDETQIYT